MSWPGRKPDDPKADEPEATGYLYEPVVPPGGLFVPFLHPPPQSLQRQPQGQVPFATIPPTSELSTTSYSPHAQQQPLRQQAAHHQSTSVTHGLSLDPMMAAKGFPKPQQVQVFPFRPVHGAGPQATSSPAVIRIGREAALHPAYIQEQHQEQQQQHQQLQQPQHNPHQDLRRQKQQPDPHEPQEHELLKRQERHEEQSRQQLQQILQNQRQQRHQQRQRQQQQQQQQQPRKQQPHHEQEREQEHEYEEEEEEEDEEDEEEEDEEDEEEPEYEQQRGDWYGLLGPGAIAVQPQHQRPEPQHNKYTSHQEDARAHKGQPPSIVAAPFDFPGYQGKPAYGKGYPDDVSRFLSRDPGKGQSKAARGNLSHEGKPSNKGRKQRQTERLYTHDHSRPFAKAKVPDVPCVVTYVHWPHKVPAARKEQEGVKKVAMPSVVILKPRDKLFDVPRCTAKMFLRLAQDADVDIKERVASLQVGNMVTCGVELLNIGRLRPLATELSFPPNPAILTPSAIEDLRKVLAESVKDSPPSEAVAERELTSLDKDGIAVIKARLRVIEGGATRGPRLKQRMALVELYSTIGHHAKRWIADHPVAAGQPNRCPLPRAFIAILLHDLLKLPSMWDVNTAGRRKQEGTTPYLEFEKDEDSSSGSQTEQESPTANTDAQMQSESKGQPESYDVKLYNSIAALREIMDPVLTPKELAIMQEKYRWLQYGPKVFVNENVMRQVKEELQKLTDEYDRGYDQGQTFMNVKDIMSSQPLDSLVSA
ncbi:hypothetical protein DIPPA_31000 [Diplonema papillatum]|nr:hypothetical protein DIPPA_31000 [Diplonema papillatum]